MNPHVTLPVKFVESCGLSSASQLSRPKLWIQSWLAARFRAAFFFWMFVVFVGSDLTISNRAVGQDTVVPGSGQTVEGQLPSQDSPSLQTGQIRLPENPNQVVCSLQYSGGFRAPPQPGFQETPLLRVFANGKVLTGGSSPKARVVEMRLTDSELQDLMHEILVTHGFSKIQAADIDLAIKQTGERIMIVDAPETEILVSTAVESHQVKQYASQYLLRQFPQIDLIKRLAAVENRLRRVYAVAQLGGNDAVVQLLESVNEVASQHADKPRFAAHDLTWANLDSSGTLLATFRKVSLDSAGLEVLFGATAHIGTQGDVQIDLTGPTRKED